jgi:hypothetical protein
MDDLGPLSVRPSTLRVVDRARIIGSKTGALRRAQEAEEMELAERYEGLVPVFHVGNHGGANMRSNWPNELVKPSVQPSAK